MMLMTKEILAKLPTNEDTANMTAEQEQVIVKFFNPCGAATWFAVSGDKREDGDIEFFGYVKGLGTDELGYFSLNELASVKNRMGLGIERDMHYGDHTLAEVMRGDAGAQ